MLRVNNYNAVEFAYSNMSSKATNQYKCPYPSMAYPFCRYEITLNMDNVDTLISNRNSVTCSPKCVKITEKYYDLLKIYFRLLVIKLQCSGKTISVQEIKVIHSSTLRKFD